MQNSQTFVCVTCNTEFCQQCDLDKHKLTKKHKKKTAAQFRKAREMQAESLQEDANFDEMLKNWNNPNWRPKGQREEVKQEVAYITSANLQDAVTNDAWDSADYEFIAEGSCSHLLTYEEWRGSRVKKKGGKVMSFEVRTPGVQRRSEKEARKGDPESWNDGWRGYVGLPFYPNNAGTGGPDTGFDFGPLFQ